MKKVLFSVLTLLFATGLFAQTNDARQAAINNISIITAATALSPAERAAAVTDKITAALNTSKAQYKAIYEINLDAARKMEEISKYAPTNQLERKYNSLFEDTNNKILRVLKPEQKAQYRTIIQKSIAHKKHATKQ